MGAITKFGAFAMRSKIMSAYNNLRHFVQGRANGIDERLMNIEIRDASFLGYFGISPSEYLRDLPKKRILIEKGDYNSKMLEEELGNKVLEINSLPLLIQKSTINL